MHIEFYVVQDERKREYKEISKERMMMLLRIPKTMNTRKIQQFEVDSDRCFYRLNLKHHLDCYTHFEYYDLRLKKLITYASL